MTYLILHKVRGEPAFDIAEPMEVDGETWWVIPTSGHRAYPYQKVALSEIVHPIMRGITIPADWPDHYQAQGSPPPSNFNIMEAISGLLPKIKRRV